jgi:hypothetical protein
MARSEYTYVSVQSLFGVVILICAVASGASSPSTQQARGNSSNGKEHPTLQVISTNMTSYSSQKYLYLRVLQDGTAEYHNIVDIDLTKPIPLVAKKLAQEDIDGLIALLSLPSVRGLSGTFEREDLGVFHETLAIEIYRDRDLQKVSLVNFHSHRNAPGRPPYPEAAVRLGCMVDRLEQKAKSKSNDWQSEECKNLPKVN